MKKISIQKQARKKNKKNKSSQNGTNECKYSIIDINEENPPVTRGILR